MNTSRIVVSTIAVFAFCAGVSSSEEVGVDELIQSIRASEKLIHDLTANVSEYTITDNINGPEHTDLYPEDGLTGSGRWYFTSGHLERLERTFLVIDAANESTRQLRQDMSHDGERYYKFMHSTQNGTITAEFSDIHVALRVPRTFLGYGLTTYGPKNISLSDLLALGQDTKIISHDSQIDGFSCIEVKTIMKDDLRHPDAFADRVVVWIDPEHGFKPRRIESYRNDVGSLNIVHSDIKLVEAAPGIWLPIEGYWSWHAPKELEYIREDIPEEKIWYETTEVRHAAFRYESMVLLEKRMVVDGYEVNSGLSKDFFRYKFPPGAAVYDNILKEGYYVGGGLTP